jgi:hypothetical protein
MNAALVPLLLLATTASAQTVTREAPPPPSASPSPAQATARKSFLTLLQQQRSAADQAQPMLRPTQLQLIASTTSHRRMDAAALDTLTASQKNRIPPCPVDMGPAATPVLELPCR